MLSVKESIDGNLSTRAPMLDLHEIQATVLRLRPAPYFGSHVALRVDDAQAGRELLRRLTPHVDSAANWWKPASAWLSVAISYAGLEALGLPQNSLQSFPEAFRVGMAARSRELRDEGVNDPKNWEPLFGKGQIHIGLSAFSDSEEKWRRVIAIAREQYEGFSGVSVLAVQDFGAQPGDLNSLGYKDGIDQPAIEGSGVEPLPGQGRPIKAGEFILGYPGEAGVPLADAAAGHTRSQRHLCGLPQISVARRRVQSIPPGEWKHRGRTGIGRREAGRPLAQRRSADAGAGRRQPRTRRGPAAEQRLRLRERSARPAGAVRMLISGA